MSRQALDDGVPVLLQAGGERVKVGKLLGSRADDPVFEMLAGAGGEDLGEAANETVGCSEFRAMSEDLGQLPTLTLREPVGVTHDPPGDLPNRWRRGPDDADAASASWPQVVTDDLVAAAVAEGLELGVELDRVGESVRPAFVQVGLVRVELAGPWLPPAAEQLLWSCRAGTSPDRVPAYV